MRGLFLWTERIHLEYIFTMKRALKMSAVLVSGLVLLLFLLIASSRLYFSDARLKSMLEDRIGDNLNSRVRIGSFEISGWLEISAEDISVTDSKSDSIWLSLDKFNVRIAPASLLSGRFRIIRIIMDGGYLDYGKIPYINTVESAEEESDAWSPPPIKIALDTCAVNGFRITGPEGELAFSASLGKGFYNGTDDLSLTYIIEGNDGIIRYVTDAFDIRGVFGFSIQGSISDHDKTPQNLVFGLDSITISAPDSYDVGKIDISVDAVVDLNRRYVNIEKSGITLNNVQLAAFSGGLEFGDELKVKIEADTVHWEIAQFEELAERFGLPVESQGQITLHEGKFTYTPGWIGYDFTLYISELSFDFGDRLKITGINGLLFSDGDLDEIIFGSSLSVRSVSGSTPDGSTFLFEGISSAVEAEITESDYSLNITSDIKEFLGGELDLSAFSENSKVVGELTISNISLAEVSSRAAGQPDTTVFGLFDLKVDLAGVLDSLVAVLRARAEDISIVVQSDTMYLGDQDLEIASTTLIRNDLIYSSVDYKLGSLITGSGSAAYPLREAAGDSLVLTFDMDVDNSLLPGYFPPSLAAAIGAVDISGWSGLKGRLTSPRDSISFAGESELSIRSTDLLIEDFQSLLFQLVSISEVEITDRGVGITFNGDIGEFYAEDYSDLSFSGISFQGEIISSSDTTWRLTNFAAEIPSLNCAIYAAGDFGFAGDIPFSNFTVRLDFHSEESVALNSVISARGDLAIEMATEQRGNIFRFSGVVSPDNMTLSGTDMFYCDAINGRIPFSGSINLDDSLLIGDKEKSSLARSTYRRIRSMDKRATGFGNVDIGIITSASVSATDIEVDISFKNGILEVPYFSGDLLGGDFIGRFNLDLREVNLLREYPDYENLRYDIGLEMASLDFNQLVYGLGPYERKANFTADAAFGGRGIIAPGEDYSIEGMFHISEMGPQVVDRVLDVIDPENQNPGVAQTRSLLNKKLLGIIDMSYRPTRFSFEIKHGAMYPRLFMKQPFFADVIPILRVPMPIEYGRIPLNTIVNTIKENP